MLISSNSKLRVITGIALCLGLGTLIFYCPPFIFSILMLVAMCIMIRELQNMMRNPYIFLLLLPIYPILPCLILIYFNQNSEYKVLLSYLFITVFSFDSGSYFAGSLCSKSWATYKIIPSISPGKSWEGVYGGFVTTTVVLLIVLKLHNREISWHIFMLSVFICVIAFIGDIFESLLKRSANLKDSGTLLPGHGGFLDRFDSILFVSYFFFIFKDFLLVILP